MAGTHKELEVKFYLRNMLQLRGTLAKINAVLIQPRTYERNLRFDTPKETLTKNEQVLRLRQDQVNLLTYKGPSEPREGVSSRTEIEFTVGNFDKAQRLLEVLGFQVSMIYEKYRTAYQLAGTLVTLDEMPFGNFVEIEGEDGETIRKASHQLGLIWELRTLQSYAELFEIIKQNLQLAHRDLTFENFAGIEVRAKHFDMVPADP